MVNDGVKIGIKADPETNGTLEKWRLSEGRSKRRHAEILLRKLCQIRAMPMRELLRLPGEDLLRRLEVL